MSILKSKYEAMTAAEKRAWHASQQKSWREELRQVAIAEEAIERLGLNDLDERNSQEWVAGLCESKGLKVLSQYNGEVLVLAPGCDTYYSLGTFYVPDDDEDDGDEICPSDLPIDIVPTWNDDEDDEYVFDDGIDLF